MNALIAALIMVESGGNDLAMGDHGKARGPLQIHQIMVDDVNRFSHTHYTWASVTNRDISIQICQRYFGHYAANKSDEVKARIWNGGPSGMKEVATLKYWEKVKKFLK